MGIGSRETYIPALKDHSIDLVPEYIGNLLLYFAPSPTATMLDAVELELYKRLPGDLSILTPSPASDTDTVTVTDATAAMWNLKTIADLAAHSAEVKVRRAVGVSNPAGRAAGAAAEVRTRHRARQLRRDQRRRRRGDGARVGGGKGQCGKHLQHVAGDPAEPPGCTRGSGAQFPGRKHCAAGEFAKEVGPPQRCAGRRVGEADHSGLAGLNAAVSGNAGIDPDQAARNWVRDNGFDHPIGK